MAGLTLPSWLFSWLRRWFPRWVQTPRRLVRRKLSVRFVLESLEERQLLNANFTMPDSSALLGDVAQFQHDLATSTTLINAVQPSQANAPTSALVESQLGKVWTTLTTDGDKIAQAMVSYEIAALRAEQQVFVTLLDDLGIQLPGQSPSSPPAADISEPISTLSPPQTPPSLSPPSSLPHGLGQGRGNDPLFVLDTNTEETVPDNATLNTFSTWSENLLAQVSGATVSSYAWNLSQAPDLTNVSGTATANLQGTWASFTGPAHTDTISVTETPQSGSPLTQTMTFLVAGTDSPAYSASRPTSSSTWPSVVTPDQLSSSQATQIVGPYAKVGLADGSVQTSFSMPSYNSNTTPVSLVYNSTTANAQPIFLAEYQLPLGQAVPSTITAQLTFNNTPLAAVTYNTSGLNPGDIVQIALQANATGLSTGRYPWSITVSNGTNTNYSGSVNIVNQASSPFGAGWSLDNVEQLVSVSGGVMLVQPGGTSLWFASNGQGGFTTPAGDFSTLTYSNGVYTRTLTDGTKINFNASGQQTSIVDRDGNTTTFAYNGSGQLTTITDMNGQVTTLAYNSSGLLSSITDPANRTANLAYTGKQLTSITDPANDVWQYSYD